MKTNKQNFTTEATEFTESNKQTISSNLTYEIIGAAIGVHKILGPGLLESAYENCLAYEFS